MSFFKRLKDNVTVNRIEDEAFYEKVLFEAENGPRRNGLWAKAIIEAGSQEKAEAVYLKLLAQAMQDDTYLSKRVAEISIDNKPHYPSSPKNLIHQQSVVQKETDRVSTMSQKELIKEIIAVILKDKVFNTIKEEAAIQIERFQLEIELEELSNTELREKYKALKN